MSDHLPGALGGGGCSFAGRDLSFFFGREAEVGVAGDGFLIALFFWPIFAKDQCTHDIFITKLTHKSKDSESTKEFKYST